MLYKQCLLRRRVDSGTEEKVSYIPIKYAIVGNVLKLKDMNRDGKWVDGWRVLKVYGEPTSLDVSPKQAFKRHRKITGDSLPKEKK